jgi:hypothetical protein
MDVGHLISGKLDQEVQCYGTAVPSAGKKTRNNISKCSMKMNRIKMLSSQTKHKLIRRDC